MPARARPRRSGEQERSAPRGACDGSEHEVRGQRRSDAEQRGGRRHRGQSRARRARARSPCASASWLCSSIRRSRLRRSRGPPSFVPSAPSSPSAVGAMSAIETIPGMRVESARSAGRGSRRPRRRPGNRRSCGAAALGQPTRISRFPAVRDRALACEADSRGPTAGRRGASSARRRAPASPPPPPRSTSGPAPATSSPTAPRHARRVAGPRLQTRDHDRPRSRARGGSREDGRHDA